MADMALKLWLQTPLGHHCSIYIQAGFAIFPCHGTTRQLTCTCGDVECKNIGKHPATRNGLLDAVKDIELAAELFSFRDDLNVGVVCGAISGIMVLDIDTAKGGMESLERLEDMFGRLPECPTVLTGGGGYHFMFNHPAEKLPTRTNVFGKEYPGIDIRNDGGYVVWPPSLHKSGKRYEFAERFFGMDSPDMPKMWKEFILSRPKKLREVPGDRNMRSGNKSEWSEVEIDRMLSFIDPDISYMDWIFVGMALHKEGCPFAMWDNWSSRGLKYKDSADLVSHWRSFHSNGERSIGTIVEWASINGWRPESLPNERIHIDTSMLDDFVERIRKSFYMADPNAESDGGPVDEPIPTHINGHAKPKLEIVTPTEPEREPFIPQFAFNPLQLPGGLGDTVRWITKYAVFDQPELAMLNVLAFAGAVFGRRYCSPLNTRTNVYMVGIARTGGGKDHSRQMINSLAMDAGLSSYMGGNSIRSDTGMLRGLVNNASQILQLDEFGLWLQAVADPHAPFHQKAVSKALMSLYSDSKSVYHHGDYADEKAKPIKIACPNLCIYGTTTEESYTPALRRSAIRSGELNRFIVIPSRHKLKPKRRVPREKDHGHLIEWWNQFAPNVNSSLGVLVNSATVAPDPICVQWGECDDLQYDLLCEQTEHCESDDLSAPLWSRMYENTVKIAMLFAIARDPIDPVFTPQDFEYAKSIVVCSIDYVASLAEHSMAETPQEANHQEVLKAVMTAHYGISKSDLLRQFRKLRKRDLEDLLGTMIEEEVIMVERVLTKAGKPMVVYYPAGPSDSAA